MLDHGFSENGVYAPSGKLGREIHDHAWIYPGFCGFQTRIFLDYPGKYPPYQPGVDAALGF